MSYFRIRRSENGILTFHEDRSNLLRWGHVLVGSLGGAPQPGNDSLVHLRSAQWGQNPHVEFKGKSWLKSVLDNKVRMSERRA